MVETRIKLGFVIFILIGLLASGTFAYHYVENWSLVDSFYFTATTLTTIGYGDLVPSTDASKLMTVAFALSGVAMFLYGLSVITSFYIQKGQQFEAYEERKIREIISNISMPFGKKKGLKKWKE